MDKIKTDKEIIEGLIEELGFKSTRSFAIKLGYKNGSVIQSILLGYTTGKITDQLIKRIKIEYPNINEKYLKTGELPILFDEEIAQAQNNINISFALNAIPTLLSGLIEEQKKTNDLLKQILDKKG